MLDTTPRTSMLSGFNGLDPNGTWTLTITGEAVPEPGAAVLPATALLAGMRRRRVLP